MFPEPTPGDVLFRFLGRAGMSPHESPQYAEGGSILTRRCRRHQMAREQALLFQTLGIKFGIQRPEDFQTLLLLVLVKQGSQLLGLKVITCLVLFGVVDDTEHQGGDDPMVLR